MSSARWQVEPVGLGDAAVLRVPTYGDARGSLTEMWNPDRLPPGPLRRSWSQVNIARSLPGVLRGLHLQHPTAQHKLVRVLAGRVWDVIVDLRPDSSTVGQWHGRWLSADNCEQLYVPAGFAHGFCVPSDGEEATVVYLLDPTYRGDDGLILRYDAPQLNIPWPVSDPVLSPRDAAGQSMDAILRVIRGGN